MLEQREKLEESPGYDKDKDRDKGIVMLEQREKLEESPGREECWWRRLPGYSHYCRYIASALLPHTLRYICVYLEYMIII